MRRGKELPTTGTGREMARQQLRRLSSPAQVSSPRYNSTHLHNREKYRNPNPMTLTDLRNREKRVGSSAPNTLKGGQNTEKREGARESAMQNLRIPPPIHQRQHVHTEFSNRQKPTNLTERPRNAWSHLLQGAGQRGLWYSLRLAGCELVEEFRSNRPYSPFLLLLGLEILLIFTGMAFLYSNSNSYMLQRHIMWLSIGISIGFIIYFFPIRTIIQCIPCFAVLALLLNALPQIPILQLANDGSPRWIRLWGYSFQVSETLRLMLVLYFARRISIDLLRYRHHLQKSTANNNTLLLSDYFPKVLWRPLLYLLLASILVILQKDYSTTVLLLVIASAMASLVGSWATLGIVMVFLATITLIAMLFLGQTFRLNRVLDWLEGSGEQINWVYDALRKGALFGSGLGQGKAKHLIPAEMTDFPLAAVAEEAGLWGIILVFSLFLAFAIVGFHLARQSHVLFVRYATTGLVGLVFSQAFVNFSVSCGILPVTGQPLPFFSVGGSSTMTYLIVLGLINSLNRPSRNLRSGNRKNNIRTRRKVLRKQVSKQYQRTWTSRKIMQADQSPNTSRRAIAAWKQNIQSATWKSVPKWRQLRVNWPSKLRRA